MIKAQIVLAMFPDLDATSTTSAISARDYVEDVVLIIFIICPSFIQRVRLREPIKKGGNFHSRGDLDRS